MITTTCGTATGWSVGQTPFVAYAMCDLWSALSRFEPSQQSGKMTCRRRLVDPQFGTVVEGLVSSSEHPQKTTSVLCGVRAAELPPIITRLAGKARTGASVFRR